MNSLATLRWNHGGRNVCSIARMRGGKITKSIASTAGRVARRLQHEEDRRIGMVEADRADRVEAREVVLVRRVVAVPRDDVERRVVDRGRPQVALELGHQLELAFAVLEPRVRRQEVARIGEAVAADRRRDRAAAAARRSSRTRSRARRYPSSSTRKRTPRGITAISCGATSRRPSSVSETQRPLLRHDQKLAVGVVEEAVGHRAVGGVKVNGQAGHRLGSPLPAIVTRPSTKSVGAAGIGNGSQRSWLGGVGTSSKRAHDAAVVRRGGTARASRRDGCDTSTCAGWRGAAR